MPCVRASSGFDGRVRLALNFHRAAIGAQRSGDDVHQRALARAVLADERVYLALTQLEIDAIERDGWAKGFVDAFRELSATIAFT